MAYDSVLQHAMVVHICSTTVDAWILDHTVVGALSSGYSFQGSGLETKQSHTKGRALAFPPYSDRKGCEARKDDPHTWIQQVFGPVWDPYLIGGQCEGPEFWRTRLSTELTVSALPLSP